MGRKDAATRAIDHLAAANDVLEEKGHFQLAGLGVFGLVFGALLAVGGSAVFGVLFVAGGAVFLFLGAGQLYCHRKEDYPHVRR